MVRIFFHNIRNGFTKNGELQEQRVEEEKNLLDIYKPDIVAFLDSGDTDISKLFKYQFVHKTAFYHPRMQNPFNTNAIMSQYPVNTTCLRLSYTITLRSSITINGRHLNMDLIHFSPLLTEKEKEEDLNTLFKEKKRPYVLAGDFNSLSPNDIPIDEKLLREEFLKAELPMANLDELLKKKVIEKVMVQGLQDPFANTGSTVPTKKRYEGEIGGMRIDYLFHSRDLSAKNVLVVKNNFTEVTSDHYPLMLDIDF